MRFIQNNRATPSGTPVFFIRYKLLFDKPSLYFAQALSCPSFCASHKALNRMDEYGKPGIYFKAPA